MWHTVCVGNKNVILECSNAFPWWQSNPSWSIHSGFMFFIKNFHNFRVKIFVRDFLELFIKNPESRSSEIFTPKIWQILARLAFHDYQVGNTNQFGNINSDTLFFTWKHSFSFGNCFSFPIYFAYFQINSELSKLKVMFLS